VTKTNVETTGRETGKTRQRLLSGVAEHAAFKGNMLKGRKAIADFLDLPEQQVAHLCRTGQLPGVFKLGRLYHARKSALINHVARLEQGAN
jgi:hypothetical protein